MQLIVRCEGCGAVTVIHHGDVIDMATGLKLPEQIVYAVDSHRCPK